MSGNPNLQVPDEAERAKMSREELGALGMAMDGVELAEYGERYIPGSPADKRAERQVAKWFLLAGLMAVLFIIVVAVPAVALEAASAAVGPLSLGGWVRRAAIRLH